ncbi:HAMP domain-containing protein, partial [Aureimonas leprariae]
MRFQNLKLSRKLLVAFAAVMAASILADLFVLRTLNVIADSTEKNARSFDLSLAVDAMLLATIEQQNTVRGLMASGDEKYVGEYEAAKQALTAEAGTFKARTVSPEQRARVEKVEAIVAHWQSALAERQIALMRDPNGRDQARALTGTIPLTEARKTLTAIQKAQDAIIESRLAATKAADGSARLTLLVGGMLAVLIAVAMGILLSRSIVAPIGAMTAAMRRLAGGDLTADVPSTDRRDEVGAMAKAVQVFKDAANQ